MWFDHLYHSFKANNLLINLFYRRYFRFATLINEIVVKSLRAQKRTYLANIICYASWPV